MSTRSSTGTSESEQPAGMPAQGTGVATDARDRTLFELAPDGILIADPQGRYLDANPGICRMLGFSRDELVGMCSADIVAAHEAEHIAPALDAIKSASGYQRDWTFRRRDGTTFDADVVATPLPDGNLLAMVRDVSDSRRAHEYREHLVAIVESSGDAIIGKDLDGIITSWNGGAEAMFGYPADEAIGMSIRRLIPDDREHEQDAILARLQSGERVEHVQTRRQTRDGRILDVSITVSPIRDAGGRIIGAAKIARDITEQKAQEHELRRITGLYAALSQINQAIVMTPSRDALLERICQVLVEDGGFRMAWIGWHDSDTSRLVPVAFCGDEGGYLQSVQIFGDDRPEGRGPMGTAFREGRTYICNDILQDPATLPWRPAMHQQGFRASAAFPIREQGVICGTVTVYADQVGFFRDKEIALLEEATGDLSFALDNLQREAARQRADEANVRALERLTEAQRIGQIGDWELDLATGAIFWSPQTFAIVGRDPGHGPPRNLDENAAHYDPSSAVLMAETVAAVIATGEAREYDVVAVHPGGQRVSIHAVAVPRKDRDGNVIGLYGTAQDVTERELAEEALRQSEASLADAQRIAQIGSWDWNIVTNELFWSAQIFELFGFASGEFARTYETFLQGVHPEDRERTHQAVQEAVAGTAAYNLDHRVRWPDGTVRWMHEQGEVTRDAEGRAVKMAGTVQDITERVEAESRLRESEDRFRTMANSMSQLAWIAKPDGFIYWYNQRWYEYTGTTPEAMEGWGWQSVHDPALVDNVVEKWRAAIAAGEPFEMECPLRGADGRFRMFLTRALPLKDAAGKIVQWFGTNTDVHDLKQAEEHVRQINADLEQRVIERTAELEKAMHAARAADRLKSAFLATMSHELRTPLNSIIGLTGILLQRFPGPLNPVQAKQLGMVSSSADHLLELINDVLDISRIEAGQLAIHATSFDLREAIERVMTTVGPLAEKKGLELDLVVETPLGAMVSDRRRLSQVLINLLGNAIKFTERGSVTLSAEWVQAPDPPADQASGGAVRLQVADTGIGMRSDELAGLFKPFHQLDSGLNRQHDGTGLGLAISSRLCRLLGGDIAVCSEWGRGSTFTVTVPRHWTPEA